MPTDKELAVAYRLACQRLFMYDFDDAVAALKEFADELDPPKPEYPDGTVAWVTSGRFAPSYKPQTHLCQRQAGDWVSTTTADGSCLAMVDEKHVIKVEPLRVLAEGEIAIDRAAFGVITTPSGARQMALDIEDDYNATAAAPWLAYSDALKAEAGDRP